MNLQFLNPFSHKFLDSEPENKIKRQAETARNTYGIGADVIDWGQVFSGRSGNYSGEVESNNIVFDTVFANKMQKINWYRNMSMYPLVQKAITIMTDEAVCEDAFGNIAKFELQDNVKGLITDTEFNSLKVEFDYIINAVIGKDKIWDYYHDWLIDGELFWEVCLSDDGNQVIGINQLPTYSMAVIYDKYSPMVKGYIENVEALDPNMQNQEVKRFLPEQIAYASYGRTWNNRNDVRGHLEAAIRTLNQLKNIEDSLVTYRITRATEKRLFNIYVGRMSPDRAAEKVQEVIQKYRKNYSYDPSTGMIVSSKNVQAMTEDIFLPKDDAGQGTTVEQFTGSATFNGQIEDLLMFQKMVMDALQIPQDRWKSDEVSGKQYAQGIEGMSSEEAGFQRLNRRLRKKFVEIIKQVFLVHLKKRNFPRKFLDSAIYNIDLNPATDFDRMRDLALAEKRGGVIGTLSQFLPTGANIKDDAEELHPLFSRQYFMEKILGMSTSELLLNDAMLKREIEEMKTKAAAAKEEGGEEGEDEGGDLGF